MTHRVFSRNAASSRAMPIASMISQVVDNTVMPIWTHNQKGMQGDVITKGTLIHEANAIMFKMQEAAMWGAKELETLGIHKQNANRYLEPFQHIKVVMTTSNLANWNELRYHKDAQPEIKMLAQAMLAEFAMSKPVFLIDGAWHTPYAERSLPIAMRKMVSASCSAQVSYRNTDDTAQKAVEMFDRLVKSDVLHASPFEHQCRPLESTDTQKGNLIGWHQYRNDIEKERNLDK